MSESNLIVIETTRCALVYKGEPGSLPQLLHLGKRLNDYGPLLATKPLGPAILAHGPANGLEPSLRVTHSDGNPSTILNFDSVSQTPTGENILDSTIRMVDPAYPFSVHLHHRSHRNFDIIEQWIDIVNDGTTPITLHSAASLFLQLRAQDFFLTDFCGGWSQEMRVQETRLPEGTLILDTKRGTMASMEKSPSFMLALDSPAHEDHGMVIAATLRWSGNWRYTFQKFTHHTLAVTGGLNPFAGDYRLDPGERLTTPAVLLTISSSGKGEVSRRFHSFARDHALHHGKRLRPVVRNSWEGTYFNFDEQKIESMIKDAAQLGIETFVLDDGWFGTKHPRNDDKRGLGDWQVNTAKLPHGLDYLAEKAKENGIGFGIWVEPEMVNPQSELFERHPEWALQLPNREPVLHRNQVVLDLGNPQVQDFIFDVLDSILRSGKISYVKWDSNSPMHNRGSTVLEATRQEEIGFRYVMGLYSILSRLRRAYPDVVIQACSSGGGRVDYGSLAYFDEFWTSDNTDAFDRVFIQWGTSHFFPANAMAAHVSASPNDFSRRSAPIKFRCDVALSGRFGIEIPTERMSPEEVSVVTSAIDVSKRIRDIVQLGDLYRLISPYESGMASLMYVTPDKSRSVLFGYMLRKQQGQEFPNVLLKGLDPRRMYRIEELNPAQNLPARTITSFSGEFLMTVGIAATSGKEDPLSMALHHEMSSAVYYLEATA